METNATRMCELLVGLPDVNVLAVDDQAGGGPIMVHIEARRAPAWCRACGVRARVKDRAAVELIDLPCFGRPARLVWRKDRMVCPEPACETGSWTVNDTVIADGQALLDADTERVGDVDALGLDETLFNKTGRWRRQQWCTSVVNVGGPGQTAQLIDIVEGRSAERAPMSGPAAMRLGVGG